MDVPRRKTISMPTNQGTKLMFLIPFLVQFFCKNMSTTILSHTAQPATSLLFLSSFLLFSFSDCPLPHRLLCLPVVHSLFDPLRFSMPMVEGPFRYFSLIVGRWKVKGGWIWAMHARADRLLYSYTSRKPNLLPFLIWFLSPALCPGYYRETRIWDDEGVVAICSDLYFWSFLCSQVWKDPCWGLEAVCSVSDQAMSEINVIVMFVISDGAVS